MGNELENSVDNLNKRIDNLLEIFKKADEEMKRGNSVTLDLLNMKLDKIVNQHEKIADAIVALTEMVQGNKKNIPEPQKVPNIPKPNIPQPQQIKPSLPNTSNIPLKQNLPEKPELPPMQGNTKQNNIPKPGQLRPLSLSGERQTLKPLGKPPRRP
jgi:hypothetical protein